MSKSTYLLYFASNPRAGPRMLLAFFAAATRQYTSVKMHEFFRYAWHLMRRAAHECSHQTCSTIEGHSTVISRACTAALIQSSTDRPTTNPRAGAQRLRKTWISHGMLVNTSRSICCIIENPYIFLVCRFLLYVCRTNDVVLSSKLQSFQLHKKQQRPKSDKKPSFLASLPEE